jgi:GNAT superfamily N-acetyltransferase
MKLIQGLSIRPIRPSDSSQMEKLYQQSANHLRALGDRSEFLFDAQVYLKDGFGENPAFFGIVAELEETLVGYLLYTFFYDTDHATRVMFVLDLLVDQKQRQKGIGQALMQEAKLIAKTREAKDLFWAVYKHNSLAENFYTKLGASKISDVFFMTLPVKPT